jgi:hypothetical protein
MIGSPTAPLQCWCAWPYAICDALVLGKQPKRVRRFSRNNLTPLEPSSRAGRALFIQRITIGGHWPNNLTEFVRAQSEFMLITAEAYASSDGVSSGRTGGIAQPAQYR